MDTQGKRSILIVACLTAAGAAVVAVGLFHVPIRSLLFFAMIALCPLSHLLMGHGAHGHGGAARANHHAVQEPAPSGEAGGGDN